MPTTLKFNSLKFLLLGSLVVTLLLSIGVNTASAIAPAGTMACTAQSIATSSTGAANNSIAVTSSATEITAANDFFIRIPTSVNARFDTADTTVVISQSSTGVTSTTVSYPVNNKTVKFDVTTNFASGENVQITGLSILGDAVTAATALVWAVDNTTEGSATFSSTSGCTLAVTATDAAATLVLADAVVGATQTTTITTTLSVAMANTDTITFTAPSLLSVSTLEGVGQAAGGTLRGASTLTCVAVAQVVTCTINGASAAAGAGLTITLTGLTGRFVGTTDITDLAINDTSATPAGADINSDTTVAVTDTTVGTLTSTSMSAATLANSTLSSYTIAFTIVGVSLQGGGKIVLVFPSGYDLSGVSGSASNLSGLDGTWAASVSSQTLTLTQSGGNDAGAGAKSLVVANIRNPASEGTTGTFTLTTRTSADVNVQTATPAGVTISTATSSSSTLGDIEDIEVTDNPEGGVLITWTDPSDDTSYVQILKGTDPYPVSGTPIATVVVTDESYVDEDVEIGETVTYMLRGSDGSDTGDLSAEYSFVVGSSLEEEAAEEGEEEAAEEGEEEAAEEGEEEEAAEEGEEESEEEEEESEEVEFTDIEVHWAVDEITTMADYGIAQGDPEGTFRPDDSLNRAEAAALLWRVLSMGNPDEPSDDPFGDVPVGEWYAAYVAALKDLDLVNGNPDGTYEPGENINRAEFLQLAVNVYLYLYPEMEDEYDEGELTDYYVDLDTAAWFGMVVSVATDWGFVSGSDCDGGKCFNAANNISRAEAIKILYNMFADLLSYEEVSLTLDFDALTDANVSGYATLIQQSGRTWVEIVVEGQIEGQVSPAHIHSGSCEETGDVVYSLEDVVDGSSMTEVEVSLASLLEMLPLYVNIHESEENFDTAVSCANI